MSTYPFTYYPFTSPICFINIPLSFSLLSHSLGEYDVFQERVVRPIARSLAERRKLKQRHHLLLTRGNHQQRGATGGAQIKEVEVKHVAEGEGETQPKQGSVDTSTGSVAIGKSTSTASASASASASAFESIEITAAGLSILRDLHQQVLSSSPPQHNTIKPFLPNTTLPFIS